MVIYRQGASFKASGLILLKSPWGLKGLVAANRMLEKKKHTKNKPLPHLCIPLGSDR